MSCFNRFFPNVLHNIMIKQTALYLRATHNTFYETYLWPSFRLQSYSRCQVASEEVKETQSKGSEIDSLLLALTQYDTCGCVGRYLSNILHLVSFHCPCEIMLTKSCD